MAQQVAAHVPPAERSDLGGLTHPVRIGVTDYHTAGEPFRIIRTGVPAPPGANVLERRAWLRENLDGVRRLLVNEPRGHADMYGAFVVPSNGPDQQGHDAACGTVFFHKDGYSTACGHGTIALATWAVNSGLVQVPADADAQFSIDVPSGRVQVVVKCLGGQVVSVRFRNVPSWVVARGIEVATSAGTVLVDVSYGGAFYASARAADLGFSVTPRDLEALVRIGREIKWALNSQPVAAHPTDPRLTGMYGTIWWEDLPGDGDAADGPEGNADGSSAAANVTELRQRSVTIFADGEIDRSPCGSGTSARLALLAADRPAEPFQLDHWSIVDTRFTGRVLGIGPEIEGVGQTWMTEVEGSAYATGQAEFTLDPRDDLGLGFQLR
ncbi:MAG: proline racemase family protein [Bifidobacteriaceae bacterium]|jgi:proline racemase|nr:proline racemase family protein [Bifidobacteriaceae bacterium]